MPPTEISAGILKETLRRRMLPLTNFFWFCIDISLLLFLLRCVTIGLSRINRQKSSQEEGVSSPMMKGKSSLEPILEGNELEEMELETHHEENDASNFEFNFNHSFHQDCTNRAEDTTVPTIHEQTTANISKYRFSSEKDLNGFVQDPLRATFCIQESFLVSEEEVLKFGNNLDGEGEVNFSSREGWSRPVILQERIAYSEETTRKPEARCFFQKEAPGIISSSSETDVSSESYFPSEKDECGRFSQFDSESISSNDGYSVEDLTVDSDSDALLSEQDFAVSERIMSTSDEDLEEVNETTIELQKTDEGLEESCAEVLISSDAESVDSNHFFSLRESDGNYSDSSSGVFPENTHCQTENYIEDVSEEAKQVDEAHHLQNILPSVEQPVGFTVAENLGNDTTSSGGSGCDEYHLPSTVELGEKINELNSSVISSEENKLCDLKCLNSEERESATILDDKIEETHAKEIKAPEEVHFNDKNQDNLECLWEHQELIEQLRMELRKVREIGLPTIPEESETPKSIDDLKLWKIDTEFFHDDPMGEVHKFYKSYRERMRKFDILNYQKMYAIGFLQVKDPLNFSGSQKPTLASIFSQNFRSTSRKRTNTDPSEKFIRELQSDLETIYVGQTCLSWEFLWWQYEKCQELLHSDPSDCKRRRYNLVAGEFQQFQVLMQRFLEDEPYEGHRVSNFVKHRCVLRNLLQVPLVRADCLKDKMEELKKGSHAITDETLEYIMEKSIRIFWEFIKADKVETSIIVEGKIGVQVELQDPLDSELMSDVQANLIKKEKKLKGLLRVGNCLVKKLKKPREDRLNQDLFFSQVDLKLLSRVLKMSRITTDQLLWCQKKLSNISIVNKKIHREPSFSLFPC